MAAWGLGFREERLEAGWERRFAADAAALDACVSLQTLLFPGLVARTVRGPPGQCWPFAGSLNA